ncbi:MAG TPA: hypothetical protein VNB90_00295 [Cytophagaceae bacterium]|nr:hypothetical protein [Cytophagaceae bacterium]
MKKNKLHIALSIFLLAILLVGRVGLHVFHHHEETTETSKCPSGLVIHFHQEEAADCALCKLDAFQSIDFVPAALFIFFLTVLKPVQRFLLTALPRFSFFVNNKGPPAFPILA